MKLAVFPVVLLYLSGLATPPIHHRTCRLHSADTGAAQAEHADHQHPAPANSVPTGNPCRCAGPQCCPPAVTALGGTVTRAIHAVAVTVESSPCDAPDQFIPTLRRGAAAARAPPITL